MKHFCSIRNIYLLFKPPRLNNKSPPQEEDQFEKRQNLIKMPIKFVHVPLSQ